MTSRCPGCAAAVAPAADWCSLCFASLRSEPAAGPTAPASALPVGVLPSAPAAAPAPTRTPGGTWPCGCGESVPLAEARCGACGAGFLDDLAGSAAVGLILPVVGNLARLSTTARGAVLGGCAFLLALVLVLLLWLVGTVA